MTTTPLLLLAGAVGRAVVRARVERRHLPRRALAPELADQLEIAVVGLRGRPSSVRRSWSGPEGRFRHGRPCRTARGNRLQPRLAAVGARSCRSDSVSCASSGPPIAKARIASPTIGQTGIVPSLTWSSRGATSAPPSEITVERIQLHYEGSLRAPATAARRPQAPRRSHRRSSRARTDGRSGHGRSSACRSSGAAARRSRSLRPCPCRMRTAHRRRRR